MHYPEAFTDRPPPRTQQAANGSITLPAPSHAEVLARRKKAGFLGTPVPRTYVLRPIVEAYNLVLKEAYDLAKKEKWPEEKRSQWIKQSLQVMKLRLSDVTNYEDAFRTPARTNSAHPRIYRGNGTVTADSGKYTIAHTDNQNKAITRPPFFVIVDSDVPDSPPRSHLAILSSLSEFAATNQEFRWYAYGFPILSPGGVVVTIDNLDYLYIKNAYPRRPR